jgi:MFS family permease
MPMLDIARCAGVVFGSEADMLEDTPFQMLLAATFVVVLGTTLVSPVLDTLREPLNISSAEIGLLVTAFVAPPVILIPLGGSLADRYGRRAVLVSGLILFGGAGSTIAFTADFHTVLGLRSLQGVGYAFTLPVVITCIRDFYDGGREVTGQGIRLAVGGVSQMIVPLVAGVVVTLAWQFPFLLYALALPVAVVLYLWFPEPVRRTDDRQPLRLQRTLRYVRELALLARQRGIAAILIGRALMSVVSFAFLTYNSLVVVRVLEGTPSQAALLITLWGGAYTLVATQAGRITGAVDGHTVPLLLSNLGLSIGLVVLGSAQGVGTAGLGAVVIGAGIGIGGSMYRSLISGFASKRLRGGLVGLGESVGRLAASVTPLAMGGAISILEFSVGPAVAVRWVVIGTGVVTGVAIVLSTLLFYTSPASPPS